MAHTRAITINLPTTGLTLNGAFRDTAGTIDVTLRDEAATEIGSGVYVFTSANFPDNARGSIVFYTGTLGGAANFASVTVRAGGAINPADELVEALLGTIAEKTGLITTSGVTVTGPVDPNNGSQLNLIAGDGYESPTRRPRWEFADYAGPDVTGATGKLRLSTAHLYFTGQTAPAEVIADATVTMDGAALVFEATLQEAQTALLSTPVPRQGEPTHRYQLVMTLPSSVDNIDGEEVTLLFGDCVVTRRVLPSS